MGNLKSDPKNPDKPSTRSPTLLAHSLAGATRIPSLNIPDVTMRLSSALSFAALPLTLAFVLAACGGGGGSSTTTTGGGGNPPTTCPLPSPITAPKFSTDILPALQASCGSAATSCHGNAFGPPPAGKVRYDTSGGRTATNVYNDLINIPPSSAPGGAGWVYVKPGDTTKSWLIEKVTSDSPGGGGFGTRMPQAAPNLCQASVDNLRAWIQAGAPF